jgi:hypothetical protein
MMKRRIALFLATACGMAMLVLLLLARQAGAAPHSPDLLYVAPLGDCGAAAPCYASMQAAVDAANPGDEIRVAAGVYTDTHARPRRDAICTGVVTQTVYISKTLTLRGGYSADFSSWDPDEHPVTLDPQSRGRGIYITGSVAPTIEGLRITNGDATGLGGYEYVATYDGGGGIYVITATATLLNNEISDSRAAAGGGVCMVSSDGTLAGNVISGNLATKGGAGLFLRRGAATVSGNTITANTSTNIGGGVYLFGANGALTNNTITLNTATSSGGGMDVASCSPRLSGNIITANTAKDGGGIYLWYGGSQLTNNVIADNTARVSGSGIWVGGSQPHLLHTTIARNSGGDGSGVFITDDYGSVRSAVVMTNTLLISHTVGIFVRESTESNTVGLNGVLWFNTPTTVSGAGAAVTLENQHTGDPMFAADAYHLTAGSAAQGRGVAAGILTDIDGEPRPAMSPDLGADQYWLPGGPRLVFLPQVPRGR